MSKWHFSSVYFWPPEPMGQKLMISFCCFELKLKKLSFTVLYQMARRKGHHQPHRLPCSFLQNLGRRINSKHMEESSGQCVPCITRDSADTLLQVEGTI